MRKAQGVKGLIKYLDSINYPITEELVNELILKREIPHSKHFSNNIMFDLNHIDWWVHEKKNAL